MNTLYKVNLFAIDDMGERRANILDFFSSYERAMEHLRTHSVHSLNAGHTMHPKWDWFLHLTIMVDKEGEYRHKDNGLYAHFLASPDDFVAHGEYKTFENLPIFNL